LTTIANYWPACDHGAILVTTQNNALVHRTLNSLKLESFAKDASRELLLDHLPPHMITDRSPQNMAVADAICHEIDGLPLLVVGLAGYISQTQLSFSEVLALLQETRDKAGRLLNNNSSAATISQYERPMHMVFSLALDALPPIARRTLDVMAMLSPDAIPEQVLASSFHDKQQ
jgi:hypothetical protein